MSKSDNERYSSNEFLLLVAQFEQVVAGNASAYFEGNEVEDIIEYYITKSQFIKALRACDYAIEKFPFSYDFLSTKAEVFISLEKTDDAIEILNYQVSMGNADNVVFCLYGDAYLTREEYTMALKYYKKALSVVYNNREKEDIYFDIAFTYQSMEQYSLAIKYLLKCIESNPKHIEAINELGVCVEIAEEHEKGIAYFERIIDRNPYCDLAWYYLGLCHKSLDQLEKAANAFEYCTIINEKNDIGWQAFADILFEMDRYNEALEIFTYLEKEGDVSDDLYKRIGLCHYNMENISEAKAYYNKGIKQCISEDLTDELWYLLGEAFEAEDNYESAKKCYKSALDKYDSEIYWAALAFVEQELGNYEMATQYYSNAIEGDPYNESLWEAYAHCMIEHGDFDKSIELLESGLVIMPKSANLRYLLSGCMIKGGVPKQGNQELEKALTMNYKEHQTIFEYFPELQKNQQIINLIEQYKLR